jgi:hypothetical protein
MNFLNPINDISIKRIIREKNCENKSFWKKFRLDNPIMTGANANRNILISPLDIPKACFFKSASFFL